MPRSSNLEMALSKQNRVTNEHLISILCDNVLDRLPRELRDMIHANLWEDTNPSDREFHKRISRIMDRVPGDAIHPETPVFMNSDIVGSRFATETFEWLLEDGPGLLNIDYFQLRRFLHDDVFGFVAPVSKLRLPGLRITLRLTERNVDQFLFAGLQSIMQDHVLSNFKKGFRLEVCMIRGQYHDIATHMHNYTVSRSGRHYPIQRRLIENASRITPVANSLVETAHRLRQRGFSLSVSLLSPARVDDYYLSFLGWSPSESVSRFKEEHTWEYVIPEELLGKSADEWDEYGELHTLHALERSWTR